MEFLKRLEDDILQSKRDMTSVNDLFLNFSRNYSTLESFKDFKSIIDSGEIKRIISETDDNITFVNINRQENPVDWAKYWLEVHPLIPMTYYAIETDPISITNGIYIFLKEKGVIQFMKEIVETAEENVEEFLAIDSMLLGIGSGAFCSKFVEAKLSALAEEYKTTNDKTSLIAGSAFIAFLADKPRLTQIKSLYYILKKIEKNGVKFPLNFTVCSGSFNESIDGKEIDITNDEVTDLIHHTSQIFVNRNLERAFGFNTDMQRFPFYKPSERAMEAMSQNLVSFFNNLVQQ